MKILIVTTNQFGYLVDYYRYYSYLKKNGHSVTFLCWDFEKPRVEPENADVVYVSRKAGKVKRVAGFIRAIVQAEKAHRFDRILINWFKFMTPLLFMIPKRKMYVDIRTVSVNTSPLQRGFFDTMMRVDANLFGKVSILTESSARRLKLARYKLLPLGGAFFNEGGVADKTYQELVQQGQYDFLYVGTLHLRRIIDCVQGFHQFIQSNPAVPARFIIVGDAIFNELNEIRAYVQNNKLTDRVITLGYIPQKELGVFFQHVFCGVSYVPLLPHFDVQPSTKTYEYLINGIPVIATTIQDNVRLLKDSPVPCGVLISDNAEDFARGIAEVISHRHEYSKEAIAAHFAEYEWDNLFRKYLHDVLDLPPQQIPLAV